MDVKEIGHLVGKRLVYRKGSGSKELDCLKAVEVTECCPHIEAGLHAVVLFFEEGDQKYVALEEWSIEPPITSQVRPGQLFEIDKDLFHPLIHNWAVQWGIDDILLYDLIEALAPWPWSE